MIIALPASRYCGNYSKRAIMMAAEKNNSCSQSSAQKERYPLRMAVNDTEHAVKIRQPQNCGDICSLEKISSC